jgi:hypothetical protein
LTSTGRNSSVIADWRNGMSFVTSCSWRLIVCVETTTRKFSFAATAWMAGTR